MLEARQADLAFAHSLDAPLSSRGDPALLADVLGHDGPAVTHAIDIQAVHSHLDELGRTPAAHPDPAVLPQPHPEQIGDRLRISQMHVSRLLERALAYLRTQITKPA